MNVNNTFFKEANKKEEEWMDIEQLKQLQQVCTTQWGLWACCRVNLNGFDFLLVSKI